MWGRDMELSLGLWLMISPFVFGHAAPDLLHDLLVGGIVVTLACLAYWRPLRRIHLVQLAIAFWLIAWGWLGTRDGRPPHHQNHVIVGLLLAAFSLVPPKAAQPPRPWREFEPGE